MESKYYSLTSANGRSVTVKIFDVIGSIHDLESLNYHNPLELYNILFVSHWGHLSIIFLWLSGTLFHIGWTGNFTLWQANPIATTPISHVVWDPHLAISSYSSVPSYSGVYNWLYAVGVRDNTQIYLFTLGCELLSLCFLVLGKVHLTTFDNFISWIRYNRPGSYYTPIRSLLTYIDSPGTRMNFHLAAMIGTSSLLWSIHLMAIAIPASRGEEYFAGFSNLTQLMGSGQWSLLASQIDSTSHIFGTQPGAGSALLTFMGGINPLDGAIHLTDIAHHHLAIGILFIWAGHIYTSFTRGLGHRMFNITFVSGFKLGAYNIVRSLHLQLALALLSLSVATAAVAHQSYVSPSYPYISYDYVTTLALYVHHNWISSFLMVGSFAHATIFIIRDYTKSSNPLSDLVFRLMLHKAAVISHLSWASLFLGFHTLGLYVHNDTVVAFGSPYKQILIEPIFSQAFSSLVEATVYHHPLYTLEYSSSLNSLSSLGAGDFLAYHAVALGLHTTTLILLKGSLDAQSSRLIPDKAQLGFGFACDGPSRGGTCDVSAWDAVYLAFFWALNTIAWLEFLFHWKHLLVWQGALAKFDESSPYLNGWFRDYLWFNSGSLIRGYDVSGANDISVWSWLFLAAHLCWAVGFMFLISWRGYWQEIIDAILYIHLKTPFIYSIWKGNFFTPQALSIVQARLIGLSHFAVGFIATYAAFVLGSTS